MSNYVNPIRQKCHLDYRFMVALFLHLLSHICHNTISELVYD